MTAMMQLSAYSFPTINRDGTVFLPADALRAWLLESALVNEDPVVQGTLQKVAETIAEMARKSRDVIEK